jgi:DNA invertase Pin-like site-specific DNA recombinase
MNSVLSIRPIIAGIAEFERELVQERVRSGIAAAKARECLHLSLWEGAIA